MIFVFFCFLFPDIVVHDSNKVRRHFENHVIVTGQPVAMAIWAESRAASTNQSARNVVVTSTYLLIFYSHTIHIGL